MRYKSLDSWRGIAALLVAAFHFPAGGYIHSAALVRHAFLFVDFFFLLSGFVIAHALRDGLYSGRAFQTFIWRRLGRVYPLYAAVLAAFLILEVVKAASIYAIGFHPQTAPFAPYSYADPTSFWLHVSLLQPFGLTAGMSWNWPDWSVAAELWAYGVFALTCWLLSPYRRIVLCGLSAAAFTVLVECSSRGIDVTWDLGFVRCLYSFCIGALVYDLFARARIVLSGVLASACEFAVLGLTLAFIVFSGRNNSSFAAPLIFGLLVLVFAFQGGALSRIMSKQPFQALGRLSYAIYIVHALVVLLFSVCVSALQASGTGTLWHEEFHDGMSERLLVLPNVLTLDALTLIYLAVIVVLGSWALRTIENPAREVVNRWALGFEPSRRLPA